MTIWQRVMLPFKWCQFCKAKDIVVASVSKRGDTKTTVMKCRHQTVCEAAEFAKGYQGGLAIKSDDNSTQGRSDENR